MADAETAPKPQHTAKRTAFRLTLRQCKAARHSGASYAGAQGKPIYRVEILWIRRSAALGSVSSRAVARVGSCATGTAAGST